MAGAALVCLIPPFQSPDEPNHFFRSWQIAAGRLHPVCAAEGCGDDIPETLLGGVQRFDALAFTPSLRVSLADVRGFWALPGICTSKMCRRFVAFNNTALYPFLPYAPAAAVIAVARHFFGDAPRLLYVARAADLIVFIAIVSLALSLAEPRMRRLLFATALLPMTIYLAASVTADALTLALAFLCAAVASRSAPNGVSRRRWLFFLALTPLLASCKYLYALVPLCTVWRAPWRKRVLAAAYCAACATAWWFAFGRLNVSPQPQIVTAPQAQLQAIVFHPFITAAVLLHTLHVQALALAKSVIGIFGWMNRPLPIPFYVAYVVFGAVIFGTALPSLGPTLIFAATSAAIFLSDWLYATPLGASSIENLQGRYFIPIFPLLFLGRGHAPNRRLVIAGSAGATLVTLATVWGRYYVL